MACHTCVSRGGTSSCRGDYIEIRSALAAALYARSTSSSFLKIVFVLTAARANSTSAGRRGMRTLSQTSSALRLESRDRYFHFAKFSQVFFELFLLFVWFLSWASEERSPRVARSHIGLFTWQCSCNSVGSSIRCFSCSQRFVSHFLPRSSPLVRTILSNLSPRLCIL